MLFRGSSERFNLPLATLDTINRYELPAFLKVEQINFNIQFWKFQQCIIRKHNGHILWWRYDYSHTPGTWSQRPFVSRVWGFFWDALYISDRPT